MWYQELLTLVLLEIGGGDKAGLPTQIGSNEAGTESNL